MDGEKRQLYILYLSSIGVSSSSIGVSEYISTSLIIGSGIAVDTIFNDAVILSKSLPTQGVSFV